MPTAAQLIEMAAHTARLIPEEQSIEPYLSSRGLEIFNNIIGEMGGAHVTIPYQSVVEFNLVPGQQTYSIGPDVSYDVNTQQIIGILDCYVTNNQVRYPLVPIDEKMYRNIVYPLSQGIPAMFLLRNFNTYSEIFFQPVPANIFAATLICKQRLTQVSFNTDLTQIPPQWILALKFMIARDFMYYYGLPVDPSFIARVEKLYANLMAENVVDVTVEKTELISRNRFYYPYILGFF
ncbi:MAG: hypothetical protein EKK56_00785 [Flavobacteriaceae bacterium]|nr:MAG: hypothetical protein EKK56_00785 [Flavobacteriaceae bacterium]